MFAEPHRSAFIELIREGAGSQDMHSAAAADYAGASRSSEALLNRELSRVRLHQRSLVGLIERYVGTAARVLDVGCGTGATSVAIALSQTLGVRSLVGMDLNSSAIAAARVRAEGYGVADRASFRTVVPGALPFANDSFDFVSCISVLEFVPNLTDRRALVAEMLRVLAPGGTLALFTPRASLREYHSRRWFGNHRRLPGFPWSCTQQELREMLQGTKVRFLEGEQLGHGLSLRGVPGASLARFLPFAGPLLPWVKVLARHDDVTPR